MVHKKYKWKNGVKYGPYYYENKRVNGKVVTTYLGRDYAGEKFRKDFSLSGFKILPFIILIGILMLISALYFVGELPFLSPEEIKTLEISLGKNSYLEGDVLDGIVKFRLREGEFIPESSNLLIKYDGREEIIPINYLIALEKQNSTFYLNDIGSFGEGEGYGISGEMESYPEIEFDLLISNSSSEGEIGGSSDSDSEGAATENIGGNEINESFDEGEMPENNQSETEINETTEATEEESDGVIPEDSNEGTGVGEENGNIVSESEDNTAGTNINNEENGEAASEEIGESEGEITEPSDLEDEESQTGTTESTDVEIEKEAVEESSESETENPESSSQESEPVLSPNEKIVSGKVRKGESFIYELQNGEEASIIVGSIKINNEVMGDNLINLKVEEEKAVVTTDYTIVEKGFGEEFLGEAAINLEFYLDKYNFSVEDNSIIEAELIFDNTILIEENKEVLVQNLNESDSNITISNETFLNETLINETIMNESATETVNITQFSAVLGEPVKWEKRIEVLEGESLINVEVPKSAERVKAKKINENGEEIETEENLEEKIKGEKEGKLEINESENITEQVLLSPEIINGKNIEIGVPQNTREIILEYETPAPYAIENEFGGKKEVKIIGPGDVHYENVLVFTDIENLNVVNSEKVKIYWVEESIYLPAKTIDDKNTDGIYDYLEWIVPSLSNQTFEIIIITKAEYLDSDRNFVSDIYDEVKGLDGNWSETINDGEYVRVTFEIPLDNSRDITVFPRILNGTPKIEVYEENDSVIIAEFVNLVENEYNKVFLTNLNDTQDVFDLRVMEGSVEFDHIIDPLPSWAAKSCNFNGSASITGVNCSGKREDFTNATIDTCIDQTTGSSTVFVNEIFLNASEIVRGSGLSINVTCQASCATSSRLGLSYNNGTGWVPKVWSDSCPAGTFFNFTQIISVDNRIGTQYLRCWAANDVSGCGGSTQCCAGTGADNDDISFKVCGLSGDTVTKASDCCSGQGLIGIYNGANIVCQSESSCSTYKGNYCQNSTDSYGICTNSPSAKCDTQIPASKNSSSTYFDSCVYDNWRECDNYFEDSFFGEIGRGVCSGSDFCETINSTGGKNYTDKEPDTIVANLSCSASSKGCFDSIYDGRTCLYDPSQSLSLTTSFGFYNGVIAGRNDSSDASGVQEDSKSPCCYKQASKYIYGKNFSDITPYEGCTNSFPSDGLTCVEAFTGIPLEGFPDWDGIQESEIGISVNSTGCVTGLVSRNASNPNDYLNSCAGNYLGQCDPDVGLDGFYGVGVCSQQGECQIPPFIVDMYPANYSVFEVGIYNLTLNVTVDDDIGNLTTYIFVKNSTSNLNESLVFQHAAFSEDASELYNLTALPIDKNSAELAALWHLDNNTLYGENQTFVNDFSVVDSGDMNSFGNASPNITGGKFAGGWVFDGDGDYLLAGGTGAANGDDTSTYSAWIKRAGASSTGYETIVQENAARNGYSLTTSCNDALIQFAGRESPTESAKAYVSRSLIEDGQWHLVTGVKNETTISIYVDGVLKNSTSSDGVDVADAGPVKIGGHTNIGTSCDNSEIAGSFNGTIDEVAIWLRPLSAKEISDLYRIGEGRYYWRADTKDSDGNAASRINEFNISDTIKPSVNLFIPLNNSGVNYPGVYFSANFTDFGGLINATLYVWNSTSLIGMNASILQGTALESANLTIALPRDGTYYWNYLAYDETGNSAFASSNFSFIYDISVPLVTINFPQNTTYFSNNLPLNFNVTLNEQGSANYSLNFGISNLTMSTSDNISFSAANNSIADGSYTFQVYAEDLLRNRNNTAKVTFTIENNNITSCRNLDYSGITYYLQNNIVSNNLCINIIANNTVFDGNGYFIEGTSVSAWPGIQINANNVSVKNVVIRGSYGFYLLNSINSTISNIYINKSSLVGNGFVLTNSNFTNIYNFSINGTESIWAFQLQSSYYNSISGGLINLIPGTLSSRGIHIVSSQYNNFRNLIINGSGDHAIRIHDSISDNNNFTNVSVISTNPQRSDISIAADNDNTWLIDMPHIGNYSLSTGSKINFRDSKYGDIRFLQGISGTGNNLTRDVKIGNNSAVVRSDLNSGLNKSANITLYGIGDRGFNTPVILRDGVPCKKEMCNKFTALTDQNVMFNVTGWTNYSIGNSNPPNVKFVSPTLANNSIIYANNISINLSSNDTDQHYAFVDFNKDLVLWMRFDDINSTGQPVDISSYSNNGSLIGNANLTDNGKFAVGVELDGSGDYAIIRNSYSLNLRGGDLSISAWVKPRKLTSSYVGIYDYESGGVGGWYTLFVSNQNTSHMRISSTSLNGNNKLLENEWYHIVGVYNNATSTITLYMNGVLDNSGGSKVWGSLTESSVSYIGSRFGTQEFFNGTIDEVLIFNRTLTAQEIKALYNATSDKYYRDFTNLSEGTYNFRGYAVGSFGAKNQTEERTVFIYSTNVTSCRVLDRPNTNYDLINNINHTGAGACINITASNIIFDGKGFNINGTDSAGSYGVVAMERVNLTIKNVNISNFDRGIYFVSTNNSYIVNSSVSSSFSREILLVSSENNEVNDTKINSNEANAIGIDVATSSGNRFNRNEINLNGLALNGIRAISFSQGNSFSGGSISNSLGNAIVIQSTSHNNNFTNVTIMGTAGNSNDLRFASANLIGTYLIDMPHIGNYSFLGSGSIVYFKDSKYGEIKFLNSINGTGNNLTRDVKIGNNSAVVRSDLNSGLNKSANITLFGIGDRGFAVPTILRDGNSCGNACNNFTSLTAQNVSFNVSFWTEYKIGERPLQISFVPPTLPNNTITDNRTIPVNISITGESINEIKFNWDGTNYSFYDNSLIRMFNLNNLSVLGENDTFVKDVSQYNGNGNVVGALINNSGKYGKAFEFEPSIAQYIKIGDGTDFSDICINGCSFSAWVVNVVTGVQRTIIARYGEAAGANDRFFMLYYPGNLNQASFIIGRDGGATVCLVNGQAISSSGWHHITGVYNKSNTIVYIDGSLSNIATCSFSQIDQTAWQDPSVTFIGAKNRSSAELGWYGTIDEVMMWNRSLTSAEIQELYFANLHKYDANKWNLFINQSKTTTQGLSNGVYTYQGFVSNLFGDIDNTEQRIVTIDANFAPNATIIINSTDGSNKTKQDLNCFGTLLDNDNDKMNVSVRWYNNSVQHLAFDFNNSYNNGTFFNAVLGNGNTTKGQNWSCSLRLFDGRDYSQWINSSTLTILNSLPNVTLLIPENNNFTIDRTPNFTWNVDDDDNDALSSEFNLTCYPGCSIDNRLAVLSGLGNISYEIQSDLRYLYDNGFYYNWSVRANDSQGFGSWSGSRRINIQAFVAINLTRDVVEFKNLLMGSNDTSDDSPLPLLLENTGNSYVNVTIRASDLWSTSKNPSQYYQFKVDNKSGEAGAFIWLNSLTSYTNMPNITNPIWAISMLNYSSDRDEAEIDINISVPSSEGAGVKNSTVVVTAELGE